MALLLPDCNKIPILCCINFHIINNFSSFKQLYMYAYKRFCLLFGRSVILILDRLNLCGKPVLSADPLVKECDRPRNRTYEQTIRITCPCSLYALTPQFHIVKLGFTGVFIFLIFALKHRLWVLVRTTSLRCTQNLCYEPK